MTRFQKQVTLCRSYLKAAGNFNKAKIAVVSSMPLYAREVFCEALRLEGCDEILLTDKVNDNTVVWFYMDTPPHKRGQGTAEALSLIDDAARYCLELRENDRATLWQLIKTRLDNHIKGITISFVSDVNHSPEFMEGYDFILAGREFTVIEGDPHEELILTARLIGLI